MLDCQLCMIIPQSLSNYFPKSSSSNAKRRISSYRAIAASTSSGVLWSSFGVSISKSALTVCCLGITYCISFSNICNRSFGSRVFKSLSICLRLLSITADSHARTSCVILLGVPFGLPLGLLVLPFGIAASFRP